MLLSMSAIWSSCVLLLKVSPTLAANWAFLRTTLCRECQVADKNHRLVCGPNSPSSASTIAPAVAPPPPPLSEFPPDSTVSSSLVTLLSFLRLNPTYAYLFQLPSRPVAIPLPVSLDPSTLPLFHCLLRTAAFGNQLAIELLHTLLLDDVLAVGGTEEQLTEQLSLEFRIDLAGRLMEDVEPSEEDLTAAVGGEGCFGLLRSSPISFGDAVAHSRSQWNGRLGRRTGRDKL